MRGLLVLMSMVFFTSCSKVKRPSKPENLISKEEMVNIILDVSLIRASEGSYKVKLKKEGYSIESYVYLRHNIDSIQFAQSNEYYSYDLDAYHEIYQKVEDSLETLQKFYEEKRDSLMEGRKKKNDSTLKRKQNKPSSLERQKNRLSKDSLVPKDSLVEPKVL